LAQSKNLIPRNKMDKVLIIRKDGTTVIVSYSEINERFKFVGMQKGYRAYTLDTKPQLSLIKSNK